MLHSLLRILRRGWKRGESIPAKARYEPGKRPPLRLEAIESRCLLSFAAPVSYNIGSQPSPAVGNISQDGDAVGDFNRDGKPDLAVVHSIDGTVNILLNNGNGTFRPAVSYATGLSEGVWVSVADFNSDGKLDLAVEGSSSISIFVGNGDGTFQSAVHYAVGYGNRGAIAVGDFNGDGKLDLAVAQGVVSGTPGGAVDILLNNGNATFRPYYAVLTPYVARCVFAADLNGDGKLDLAVCDGEGYNGVLNTNDPAGVTIFLGAGNGTFKQAGQYNTPATPGDPGDPNTVNPEFVTAADFNHDGKLDLVVSLYDHNVDVLLGKGDGSFLSAALVNTWIDSNNVLAWYPRNVVVVDVNGDGIPDMVVCNTGTSPNANPLWYGSVAVLLGNGDGTFQPPTQYTPFEDPGWLAVGDFNRDGLPDIAVTRVFDGHSVNVMLNQTTAATPQNQVFAVLQNQSLWGYNLPDQKELSPPGTIASVSAAGLNDVFAVVTDHSLWEHNNSGWRLLSPAGTILSVSAVTDGAGYAVAYAVTSDHRLWEHSNALPGDGWMLISTGNFQSVSAATNRSGNAVVFGVLTNHSLWEQNPYFGPIGVDSGWGMLSPTGTILSADAITDSSGNDVVYAITADRRLWEHSPAFGGDGWQLLSTGAFLSVSAGRNSAGQAVAYGILTNDSLWENNPAYGSIGVNTNWTLLSPAGTILSAAAGSADEVFAVTADHRLWLHTLGGWALESIDAFQSISGDDAAA